MIQANRSRADLEIITDWVSEGSRVLDLGCGDGTLMQQLQQTKAVSGYGLELSAEMIPLCIAKDVNVIQTNLDKGLVYFDDDSFDFVILSLTLQAIRNPKRLVQEMMRVGKQGIVTFPNFAYWRNRVQISFSGRMPVSGNLPHTWYETPNIHLCTIRDFRKLCYELDLEIKKSVALSSSSTSPLRARLLPNVFGEVALFHFSRN